MDGPLHHFLVLVVFVKSPSFIGWCNFFGEENELKMPIFEGSEFKFESKETYLSSVQTRYQWLASSYLEPNAIVTHVN